MGDEEPSRRVCPPTPATAGTGPCLPQQASPLTPGPLPESGRSGLVFMFPEQETWIQKEPSSSGEQRAKHTGSLEALSLGVTGGYLGILCPFT